MKIVEVKTIDVDIPAQPKFGWRKGLPGSWPAAKGVWFVIRADDGSVGMAPTMRGAIMTDAVERHLRQELLGRDPFERELIWQRFWEIDRAERFAPFVMGVMDTALWDLAGRSTGLPIHRLVGTYRTSIPAYASTATFETTEEFLRVVEWCRSIGYTAVKFHAWGDPKRDVEMCRAVRAEVGDDFDLMYDGSAGFDLADAIYVGKALADLGFLWYEEPMREFNITSYKWLAERVDVPLLVGEVAEGSHYSTADFIASGCAAGVRTDTQFRGGFTGALRVAHLADAFQLRAEVHGGGLEAAHLCMSIPNNGFYEALVYSRDAKPDPMVDANGMVHAPMLPGVGWTSLFEEPVGGELGEYLNA